MSLIKKISFRLFLLAILSFVFINACQKKDPPPSGGDDRLTNPYCNDPLAVNYNWGFPGKPDNSVCFYPVDTFIGNWVFLDSIFNQDSTFHSFISRTLSFKDTHDSTHAQLAMHGWCDNEIIYIRADKNRRAIVDTLSENYKGQIVCNQQDSISGKFNLNTFRVDSMKVDIKISNSSGTFFHQGWAIKQH